MRHMRAEAESEVGFLRRRVFPVSFTNGKVTFRWRDSAHGNQQKLMTLGVGEFLRCFLLHLLPKGFVRIRHFGFLANRQRARVLPLCLHLLRARQLHADQNPATSNDLLRCPKCGAPMYRTRKERTAHFYLLRQKRASDKALTLLGSLGG